MISIDCVLFSGFFFFAGESVLAVRGDEIGEGANQ